MTDLKVLMLSWEFPPFRIGGISMVVSQLAKQLVGEGVHVDVVTLGDGFSEEEFHGARVFRVPAFNAPDTASWALGLGYQMEKRAVDLFKSEDYDLIHVNDWMTVLPGAGLKKLFGKKLVFTVHSTELGRNGVNSPMSKFINDLEWLGTYEADTVITVGRELKNEVVQRFNTPISKVFYIPNGCDYKLFEKRREWIRHWFAADWEKMLLFSGRLHLQKGFDYLLRAMPLILSRVPEAKLVVAGGGDVDRYRLMASHLGLGEKVYFLNHVNDVERLVALYQQADVTVIPSVYEPFGLVSLESQASKTPVVASYTGGLKDNVVHRFTGLHSFPAHSQSIADQTVQLLESPDMVKRYGENGFHRVRKVFTWEQSSRKHLIVYENSLAS